MRVKLKRANMNDRRQERGRDGWGERKEEKEWKGGSGERD